MTLYCNPWNTRQAAEALTGLFRALDVMLCYRVQSGAIEADCELFREYLRKQLEADGWTIARMAANGDRLPTVQVLPPGEPLPETGPKVLTAGQRLWRWAVEMMEARK